MFEQADGQGRCQELREHRVLGAALSCHLTIMFLKKNKDSWDILDPQK